MVQNREALFNLCQVLISFQCSAQLSIMSIQYFLEYLKAYKNIVDGHFFTMCEAVSLFPHFFVQFKISFGVQGRVVIALVESR